jgi:hypothetical protein
MCVCQCAHFICETTRCILSKLKLLRYVQYTFYMNITLNFAILLKNGSLYKKLMSNIPSQLIQITPFYLELLSLLKFLG